MYINGCVFSGVLVSWAHTPTHMLTQSTHTHTRTLETLTHTHTHSDSIVVVQGAVSSSSNLFVCFFLFHSLLNVFRSGSLSPHPSPQTYPCSTPSLGHSNNYACHSFMCMHTDAHAPTHSALCQRLSLAAPTAAPTAASTAAQHSTKCNAKYGYAMLRSIRRSSGQ